jgi:imidazolonepropionase-like amidohydrolase
VKNNHIEYAGPSVKQKPGARMIRLPGCTLLPGLIEGHSHLFFTSV